VLCKQARKMHTFPIPKNISAKEKKVNVEAENSKLLNIMYHDGAYFIHEPFPDTNHKRDPDLIIEKHCWLVLKYLPKLRTEIKLNDVVRFGRVTFKITELVISKQDIEKAQQTLE